jgi:hypothetical protein
VKELGVVGVFRAREAVVYRLPHKVGQWQLAEPSSIRSFSICCGELLNLAENLCVANCSFFEINQQFATYTHIELT